MLKEPEPHAPSFGGTCLYDILHIFHNQLYGVYRLLARYNDDLSRRESEKRSFYEQLLTTRCVRLAASCRHSQMIGVLIEIGTYRTLSLLGASSSSTSLSRFASQCLRHRHRHHQTLESDPHSFCALSLATDLTRTIGGTISTQAREDILIMHAHAQTDHIARPPPVSLSLVHKSPIHLARLCFAESLSHPTCIHGVQSAPDFFAAHGLCSRI